MIAAARELCVTHGAISRQVHALGAQLGASLVAGPRHRLELTAVGRELAAALSSAFDLIAAALPGAGGSEEIVISCPGTLAMKWLIPRLPSFLDANPGLRVRILEGQAPVDFGDGNLHGAVRIEYRGATDGTKYIPIMDHFVGPVAAPALLQDAHPADRVLTLPRLTSETYPLAWTRWATLAGRELPAASVHREFEHNSYMLEAAMAGLGAAVAPWAFAAADIERGRLTAPLGFEPTGTRILYLRPRLSDNAAAATFGEWLRSEGRRTAKPSVVKAASSV